MARRAFLLALAPMALAAGSGAYAREAVETSAPQGLAVTLYRDPNRGVDQPMNRDWPQGFAMISETRTVTLPPGESTVRFTGVAEGMVAVSAIVTGLPGGTIEKNRNADLLSPAALVDGTLGNRVTVTRTDPATGEARSEQAIVRTRADGGLVLETAAGFQAVRCSGLPEKLTFDRVPVGLSAEPVYSVDTRSVSGGTFTVQLTYLAWGFDWQAHYVATVEEPRRDDRVRLRLMSWLTLLNDNGQSFPGADLQVVAGRLNVTSDFQGLSDPPQGRPLQLTCFPFGSTAAGSPIEAFLPPPPPPPPAPMAAPPPMAERGEAADAITVTGQMLSKASLVATEEALGDLKLYRVPEPVTVAAKGLKQIAFLDKEAVEGRLLYRAFCLPWTAEDQAVPAGMLLTTVNDRGHGLGAALPMGEVTVFEQSAAGDLLVGQPRLRDYAEGEDVELEMGASGQVFSQCRWPGGDFGPDGQRWVSMQAELTNANPRPVTVRLAIGAPGEWRVQGLAATALKDGQRVVEVAVPANGRRTVSWQVRPATS